MKKILFIIALASLVAVGGCARNKGAGNIQAPSVDSGADNNIEAEEQPAEPSADSAPGEGEEPAVKPEIKALKQ